MIPALKNMLVHHQLRKSKFKIFKISGALIIRRSRVFLIFQKSGFALVATLTKMVKPASVAVALDG